MDQLHELRPQPGELLRVRQNRASRETGLPHCAHARPEVGKDGYHPGRFHRAPRCRLHPNGCRHGFEGNYGGTVRERQATKPVSITYSRFSEFDDFASGVDAFLDAYPRAHSAPVSCRDAPLRSPRSLRSARFWMAIDTPGSCHGRWAPLRPHAVSQRRRSMPRLDRTLTSTDVTVRLSRGLGLQRACPRWRPSNRRSVPLPPPWGRSREPRCDP